jgi:hypothetical protein
MFAFNPGVNDTSGQILGQGVVNAANTTAQANVKMVDDIGGSLMGLAGAYADKSAMKAKAQSYAKIGDILGDTMFSENPNAMNALSELKKSKNPYEAVMGYEALFNMAGPMSNAMMAGRRVDVTQQGQQIQAGMPAQRAGIDNATDVAGGRKTYNPPDLFNVVPPPTPMGFGNINQGMPGVMGGQSMRPATQPMAVRPGR